MKHLLGTFLHNRRAGAARNMRWVKAWSIREKRGHLRDELCGWVPTLLQQPDGPLCLASQLDLDQLNSIALVFYPSSTNLRFGQNIRPERDMVFGEMPLATIQLARFPDYIEYVRWLKRTNVDETEKFDVSVWGRLQDAAMEPIVDEILRQAYG